jgi:hypothetical protein
MAWRQIAARDGALQIYHIGAVIGKFREHLRSSPTLQSLLDRQKLRNATKLFESYFPNYRLIRDSIGHSFFEVAPNAKGHQQHAVDSKELPRLSLNAKPGKNVSIKDYPNGSNYVAIFENKVATYEISDNN